MPTIRFDATLYTIDKWIILRLPEKASRKLPSRGQVAVQGTINGHGFQTVLEPDGVFGHWMRIDGELQETAALSTGGAATLELELLEDWPERSRDPVARSALATPSGARSRAWQCHPRLEQLSLVALHQSSSSGRKSRLVPTPSGTHGD